MRKKNSAFLFVNVFYPKNAVYALTSGNETAAVGTKPGGISWIGAYDTCGNVREWVSDWHGEFYFGTLEPDVFNPQGQTALIVYCVVARGSLYQSSAGQGLATTTTLEIKAQ